jgi:hypothetical protein
MCFYTTYRGHYHWGLFTTLIIFAPFAARFFTSTVNLIVVFFAKSQNAKIRMKNPKFQVLLKAWPEFLLDLPIIQQIRFEYQLLANMLIH